MAQRKQKLYYDEKRRGIKYNVGDEVLKIKHNLSNAPEEKVGKFFPRFEGPFIIEKVTKAVVILKRNDGHTMTANVDQIKPFYNRSKMAVFKDFFQDPRQSISQEDVLQRKQQEPSTTASKSQKKKAPPQQSRHKNQKCGFKTKSHDAGEQIYERTYEQTKRRKQNGQGKTNVSKRTAESSDRCLRSKQRRLQPENQRPEYSRNQEQQRTRAQERRTQSTKRPAEQPPPRSKYARIQRRNCKRKRDEQPPKDQKPKSRRLNQAATYSTFKDWAKKRMDDHNKISRISYSKILLEGVRLRRKQMLKTVVQENFVCKLVSQTYIALIIGRLECGRTQLEVSDELGIAQTVISRLWQLFQDDGNVNRRYSTGHPRVTTPNEDRYLAVTAKRNRRSTASDLSCQLYSATGTKISSQTAYRRLGQIGLYARRPVRCVPLIATHCRLRLAWSREHALWTPQQWACVMFSDKSRFSLQSDSLRTFVWRAPGTRYHQENIIERHRSGGAGVLVWGGIILGSRTDLHVQIGTMTSQIYRDVILEQHVRLFRGAMGAQFVFMDDNARPHRANIVSEFLESEDITHMD
ncbi:Transposable element Tcb1 transposase, partial [Stegodyphus mimosarum]